MVLAGASGAIAIAACGPAHKPSAPTVVTAAPPVVPAAVPAQRPSAAVAPRRVEVPTPRGPMDIAWHPAALSVLDYPALPGPPLPPDCASPSVVVATAPTSSARGHSFWPWAVQTLLAHDHLFHWVPELGAGPGNERDVALTEMTSGTHGDRLTLMAACRRVETCDALARTFRAVIPKNEATLACGPGPGAATGRHPATTDKLALIPAVESRPARIAVDPCARLAACTRQQGGSTDPKQWRACETHSAKFRLDCAAQTTCYDVVRCAGGEPRSLDFDPFGDVFGQFFERCERVGDRECVGDVGGGGLCPVCRVFDAYAGGGQWTALSTDFRSEPIDPAVGYSGQGRATWHVAVVEPTGHVVLGPRIVTDGSAWQTDALPTDDTSTFDYDGDGTSELLLFTVTNEHSAPVVRLAEIWRYAGGRVALYPNTEGLPIVGFPDVDDDGRPDLVLDSLGGATGSIGIDGEPLEHKLGLAHSLPDGSFSTTDSVAREFERQGAQEAFTP
jgi:hypothetical protein